MSGTQKTSRRRFLGQCAAAAAMATAGGAAGAPARRLPNIVVLFIDDQGYNDLSCFGSKTIKTPRIDRMAAEGVKHTDFYVTASVCSPSRAALLTGRYQRRTGVNNVLFPRDNKGLPARELTIAEGLKTRGYTTACFGKWHLGHLPPFLPTRHGFDHYLGIPYSNDMWIDPKAKLADDIKLNDGWTVERIRAVSNEKPKKNLVPLMRDEEVIEFPVDQSTLTERYTDEAVKFIQANKDKPFFLYIPHTMPHIPLHVSERFRGKSAGGLYGDVIECLDWSTGRILDTLKECGVDENTLVIYTSDNGPWLSMKKAGGNADPLRDGKFSMYEGGVREPFVARWPGVIPAGTVCSEPAATIDFLPTFFAMAGVETLSGQVIDGKDILPLLCGRAKSPHEYIAFQRGGNLGALRAGKWKYHPARGGNNNRVPAELYDLSTDIGEKKNLADERPEVVKKMEAYVADWKAKVKAGAPGIVK